VFRQRCNTVAHALTRLRLQVTHYASDGWLVHKSSEDARKQLEQEKTEAEAAAKFQAELDRALKEKVRTPVVDNSAMQYSNMLCGLMIPP
jgi:hypothetical protein